MRISNPASRIQANINELFQASLSPGDAYIRFQLTSNMTVLLSMTQVQESLIVEVEKITPLPSMPESVIGIMSSRDRVFCVFDLAQLFNLETQLIARHQYQVIVVQTTTEPQIQIGLAVKNLQGIIRLTTEQIQASHHTIHPSLIPYISGVAMQPQIPLAILNLEQILESVHKTATPKV
jgi:positive phototaxis protein PixI